MSTGRGDAGAAWPRVARFRQMTRASM